MELLVIFGNVGIFCARASDPQCLPTDGCRYVLAWQPDPTSFPKALFGSVLCQTDKNFVFITAQVVRHVCNNRVNTVNLFPKDYASVIFWVQDIVAASIHVGGLWPLALQ